MKLRVLAAVLAVAAAAPVARADDAVVVLIADTTGPFALRVRAELESMGFKVAVRRGSASEVPLGAVAVARLVDGRPPRIEIDTLGEASVAGTKTVTFDAATDESGIGSVLLAERVRAAFQPLAPRAVPPAAADPAPIAAATAGGPVNAAPAAPTAAVGRAVPSTPIAARNDVAPQPSAATPGRAGFRAPTSARAAEAPDARAIDARSQMPLRKSWGFALAPAFQLGPQAIDPATYLGFYASPHDRVRLEGFVSTPFPFVGGSSVNTADGTAAVYVGLVGGAATATVWSTRSGPGPLGAGQTIALLAGAGAAGVWLRAEGDAATGYVATTEDAFASLLFGSLALRVQTPWSRRMFLVPRGFVGASLPRIDVEFAGKRVGSWGAPWTMFAGTIEVDMGGS